MLISFDVNFTLSKANIQRVISFHKIKGINLNAVLSGIDSLPSINLPSTPEELVAHYNDGLCGILDALATLKNTHFFHPLWTMVCF